MFAVFTGSPHVGKSTMVNLLGNAGYATMSEIAEQVINEGEHKPWLGDSEQLAFQLEVAKRQAAAETQLATVNGPVFLDRGLVDAIAYRLIYGRSLTDLHHSMSAAHYSVAFVFDPLDGWDDNGVRYEDPDFARAMTPVMKRVYESFNVPVVSVPNVSREERLSLILGHMAQMKPQYEVDNSLRMAA